MKKLIISLIHIFYLFYGYSQEIGTPFITNYLPNEYSAESQNWSLIQDKNGLLYIGNTSGVLLEYDGINFRQIKIGNNSVPRSMAIDQNGKIYVGCIGDFGYLEPNINGKLEFVSLTSKLDSVDQKFNDIWRTFVTPYGVIYQSFLKIFIYKDDKITVINPKKTFHLSIFSKQNNFYVKDLGLGVLKYNGDSLISFPNTIGDTKFIAFTDWNTDTMLISLRPGAIGWFVESKGDIITKTPFDKFTQDIMDFQLYSLVSLPNSDIAMGFLRNGVFVFDRNGKLKNKIIDELKSESVLSTYQTKNYPLWAGTSKGFSKIELLSPFEMWGENSGFEGLPIQFLRFDSTLFIASTMGIYSLKDSKFVTVTDFNTDIWSLTDFKIPENEIKKSKGKKEILLLGGKGGVFIYDSINPLIVQRFTKSVFRIIQSKIQPNKIYIGSDEGLSTMEYIDGEFTNFTKFDKVSQKVRYIIEQSDNIWLCTDFFGIYKINNQNTTLYDTLKGLPELKNISMHLYKNKIVVTTAKGMFFYNEKTDNFEKDISFETLNNAGFLRFVFDNNNNVFTGNILNNNYFILNFVNNKNETLEIDSISLNRYPNMFPEAMYCDGDSFLWIGGADGIFRFNRKLVQNLDLEFFTLIRKITAGKQDSVIFWGAYQNNDYYIDGCKLDYIDNKIRFDYACLFFENEKMNLYSYRLIGLDTSWSAWTTQNFKEFNNLREGKYTFEVKAKNIYGKYSNITGYKFEVKSPWYRTFVAYLVYFILFILFIILVIKIFTRRLIKQKEHLENIVLERTAEIRQQKEEITVQNENLLQQKEEITAQAEELLSKNEIIETAYNNVQLLSEIGKEVTASLNIKNIIATVYDHVNTLMDASVFAIGIYNAEKQRIEFDGAKEKNETLVFHFDEMANKNHFSVTCFNTQKEIIIQDLHKEYKKYFTEMPQVVEGDIAKSLIYLPLMNKDKAIGVITVQSFNANVYTDFHVNILQNIAIYTTIALENADSFNQISSQKKIIESQNDAIKGSIRYAKTIQTAILPFKENIDNQFDNFIVFRPKDIVSGDFYWYSLIN